MLQIIPNRKYFLTVSALLVLFSCFAIWQWGLKLGIDYTGGSLSEVEFKGAAPPAIADIERKLTAEGFAISSVQTSGRSSFIIRMTAMDEQEHYRYLQTLESSFAAQAGLEGQTGEAASEDPLSERANQASPKQVWHELQFGSVGPKIGEELRRKSFGAIIVGLIVIVLYIAYSFRKVSKPVSSWKYGIVAIIALIHDISIATGFMALMGYMRGWEVDLLFITALLTILGFSVHDTIVVFDRIRENLLRSSGKDFGEITNASVNQTLARSINTSFTTILVLFALFIFGGASTKQFILLLVLGIFFGTYSSIFVASPLLVIWHRLHARRAR